MLFYAHLSFLLHFEFQYSFHLFQLDNIIHLCFMIFTFIFSTNILFYLHSISIIKNIYLNSFYFEFQLTIITLGLVTYSSSKNYI